MLARLSSVLLKNLGVCSEKQNMASLVELYFMSGSMLHPLHLGISLGQGFIP